MSKLALVLLFVTLASAGIPPPPPGPQRKNECRQANDCPKFNYCHHSYWIGRSCNTYAKTESWENPVYCKRIDRDSGREFPDHSVCAIQDRDDQEFSTQRCYPELGYICRKSYHMPCTANHDAQGRVIRGQSESCPTNFVCVNQDFKDGSAKICVPRPTVDEYVTDCQTPFNCGYSVLEGGWPACHAGRCIRAVEK